MEGKYRSEENQRQESLLEGFSKLAKAVGPFGVPFTMVFMSNVVAIFMIIFLQSQFQYLWLIVILFCIIEVFLAFLLYILKLKPKKEK